MSKLNNISEYWINIYKMSWLNIYKFVVVLHEQGLPKQCSALTLLFLENGMS